jgi:hypothetical protein
MGCNYQTFSKPLFVLLTRGGPANFFLSSQIRKFLGSFRFPQIRKFLRNASPQIANSQIFISNLQIASPQISTKLCNSVSKQFYIKVAFLLDFFYYVQI